MTVISFPSIYVQPLSEESIGEASALLRDCWHLTYSKHLPAEWLNRHTLEYFQEYLLEKQSRCWLAYYNEQVAGVMAINLNCIDELCVNPNFRRKKIGRRLVETAIHDCEKRHYQSVQVGIEDFNNDAIQFFDSLGWREVGSEFVPLSPDKRVKAMVYSRAITQ